MRRFHFNERPDSFEIDPQHQYAQQLVFAGLGRFSGGLHYHDSSLCGNHGTLTNMDPATDWVRDLGRWALDFDAVNDVVTFVTDIFGASNLSISFRCFATSYGEGGNNGRICDNGKLFVGVTSSIGAFYASRNGSTIGYATNNTCPLNTDLAVVALFKGTDVEWWVNGIKYNTVAVDTPAAASATCCIGNRAATDRTWGGRISDVCVWSRALSTSEISALADPSNVMLSLGGNDPGLLRYRRRWWPVSSGAAPATTIRWPWQQRRQRRMAGHR